MKVYVTASVQISASGVRIGAQLNSVFLDLNKALFFVQSKVVDFLLCHQSDHVTRIDKDCSGNCVFLSIYSIDDLLYVWKVYEKDIVTSL